MPAPQPSRHGEGNGNVRWLPPDDLLHQARDQVTLLPRGAGDMLGGHDRWFGWHQPHRRPANNIIVGDGGVWDFNNQRQHTAGQIALFNELQNARNWLGLPPPLPRPSPPPFAALSNEGPAHPFGKNEPPQLPHLTPHQPFPDGGVMDNTEVIGNGGEPIAQLQHAARPRTSRFAPGPGLPDSQVLDLPPGHGMGDISPFLDHAVRFGQTRRRHGAGATGRLGPYFNREEENIFRRAGLPSPAAPGSAQGLLLGEQDSFDRNQAQDLNPRHQAPMSRPEDPGSPHSPPRRTNPFGHRRRPPLDGSIPFPPRPLMPSEPLLVLPMPQPTPRSPPEHRPQSDNWRDSEPQGPQNPQGSPTSAAFSPRAN
jgi:hypothetical protein